jgi:hypothetical protein
MDKNYFLKYIKPSCCWYLQCIFFQEIYDLIDEPNTISGIPYFGQADVIIIEPNTTTTPVGSFGTTHYKCASFQVQYRSRCFCGYFVSDSTFFTIHSPSKLVTF